MEKNMVRVFDNVNGRGFVCDCVVDNKVVATGKGLTVEDAMESVKGDGEKVMYFGTANVKSVFLTTEGGITSTSANYLANLAQEVIQEKKVGLENTCFLNSKIVTPICPDGLEYGKANFDFEKMVKDIQEIGNMNAFCAWMREGIKAKEAALEKVNEITFERWLKVMEKKVMERPERKHPSLDGVTDDNLSIGQRLQMLRAEAIAAAYGKFIHKDMPISDARKDLQYRVLNPVEKEGTGKELTLVRYEPAVSTAEVDKVFMTLQNKQREAEKELNHFKAELNKSLAEQRIQNEKGYDEWCQEYKSEYEALVTEYNTDMTIIREEINSLKISLPVALKPTYDYLNSLGK